MMLKCYWLTWATALTAVLSVSAATGDQPSVAGSRVCLVDGQEVDGDLYVDVAGVRLYACCEHCLETITEDRGYVRLIDESGYEPEQIPVNRSREWTEQELLEGMVLIQGGEFARPGSFLSRRGRKPEPVEHDGYTVRVSSFYMDKFEVTYDDYCRFLDDGNEKYVLRGIRRDEHGQFVPPRSEWARLPVKGANYFQAKGYTQWAGKRLPTEAEWEFAHGGSEGRKYPWGNDEPDETRANFGPMLKGLKPVGSLPEGRTPDGVFDLAGNIGEWCADYADEDYYRKPSSGNLIKDPQGPSGGYLRVYRLGCQCKQATTKDLLGNLRCSASPFRGAGCVGFRCVRSE
jgi:formylglycine-generating enzyme required for sulfatase activity